MTHGPAPPLSSALTWRRWRRRRQRGANADGGTRFVTILRFRWLVIDRRSRSDAVGFGTFSVGATLLMMTRRHKPPRRRPQQHWDTRRVLLIHRRLSDELSVRFLLKEIQQGQNISVSACVCYISVNTSLTRRPVLPLLLVVFIPPSLECPLS